MKTRVAELSIEQANAETRPYKIVGVTQYPDNYDPMVFVIVEYLDTFEYMSVYEHLAGKYLEANWCIVGHFANADRDACLWLRRIKPASASEADNG
jgi:hypothetical protein